MTNTNNITVPNNIDYSQKYNLKDDTFENNNPLLTNNEILPDANYYYLTGTRRIKDISVNNLETIQKLVNFPIKKLNTGTGAYELEYINKNTKTTTTTNVNFKTFDYIDIKYFPIILDPNTKKFTYTTPNPMEENDQTFSQTDENTRTITTTKNDMMNKVYEKYNKESLNFFGSKTVFKDRYFEYLNTKDNTLLLSDAQLFGLEPSELNTKTPQEFHIIVENDKGNLSIIYDHVKNPFKDTISISEMKTLLSTNMDNINKDDFFLPNLQKNTKKGGKARFTKKRKAKVTHHKKSYKK